MPKEEIDYSNTIFYKISCKNPSVSDIYIGHTTNFVQRKHAHKQSCKNPKGLNYNCKLYQVIREHEGWENWNMEIIAFHACENSYSARKQEQSYFEQYNASLNSIEPLPKPRPKPKPIHQKKEKVIHHCNTCNISFSTIKQHEIHNTTKKHITNMKLANIQRPNNIAAPQQTNQKYTCEKCNFICSKNSNYEKHTMTAKHKCRMNPNEKKAKIFQCECGKIYKHMSTLCNHKKKCTVVQNPPKEEVPQQTNQKYTCEKCNFNCSKKSNYITHLTTLKHKHRTCLNAGGQTLADKYECDCGKVYAARNSLWYHKKKCTVVQNPPQEEAPQPANQFLKDEIIERLVKELIAERNENKEMKSMFMLMIEKYQEAAQEANKELVTTIIKGNQEATKELVNKFIEIAPKMGNTTNNNDNRQIDNRKITFNYYLENHCKEAETPLIEQPIQEMLE